MNPTLSMQDIFSLSPLLIILGGSLIELLLESFFSELAKRAAFPVALGTLLLALAAHVFAPIGQNPLLTPWIVNDSPARFFTYLFILIGLGSILLAKTFFRHLKTTRGEYYFFLLSSILGLILIGSSGDFLTLFIGIETLSIPLYILCGYMKSRNLSHESSLKYFLTSSLSVAFLVYGVGLIYGAVGTTQFAGLASLYHAIDTESQKMLFLGGIAMVTLGLAFKAALVPFHVWAPDVYDGAPAPVVAFMAIGTKAGAFAAFARLFLIVLPGFDPLWSGAMEVLAIASILYANFVATRQDRLKRFFAYSGISHAGYMLFPIIAGTPESLQALYFYMIVYSLATFGCFAVISTFEDSEEGVKIKDLKGLFSKSPFLGSLFALCLLTLSGLPPTAGFLAKLGVFKVAFEAGYISLVVVGLIAVIPAAFFYLKIAAGIFSSEEETTFSHERDFTTIVAGTMSILFLLALSFFPYQFT